MKKKLICLIEAALFFLLFSTDLYGQQNPGDLAITYGFSGTDRPRHAEAGSAKLRAPINVRLKVHPKLVIGVDHDSFLAKKGADGTWSKGRGNVSLIFRPEFLAEEVGTPRPTVRVTYSLTLPAASVSKGLGTGRVDHKILGTLKKTISEEGATKQTILGVDFGGNFAGRQTKSGFKKAGLLNLYFERDLDSTRKYNFHGEVDLISRADSSPSQIYSTNYLKVKINSRVSITSGFILGITPTAVRGGAYGSIIINGPKLW